MELDPVAAEDEMKHGRKLILRGVDTGRMLWKGREIEDQFSQCIYGVYDHVSTLN